MASDHRDGCRCVGVPLTCPSKLLMANAARLPGLAQGCSTRTGRDLIKHACRDQFQDRMSA